MKIYKILDEANSVIGEYIYSKKPATTELKLKKGTLKRRLLTGLMLLLIPAIIFCVYKAADCFINWYFYYN